MSATAIGVSKQHITKTPGVRGGKACITGTRLTVQDVYGAYEHGMTPLEISTYFVRQLTLSQVHAALSYAYDHLDELARDQKESEEFVEEFFRDRPPGKLELLMKERRGE